MLVLVESDLTITTLRKERATINRDQAMLLRDEIAQQALALPPEDRAYVADLLEGSLQESDFASREIADAWSREIDRRIHAHKRGETTAIDADVSLQRMHEALDEHRARKARPQ